MRKLTSVLFMMYRSYTSTFRSLPDYLIVGAQKSGSTSLYDYLIQHPEVAPAKTKEVHYFSNNYEKGVSWYRAHFSFSFLSGLIGEATPYYLYHPLAADRIKKTLPGVKIMVVLRDPSSRAISHYHHAVNHGFEETSIKEAFERDLNNYKELTSRVYDGERIVKHQENSYISRGFYVEQLERYYELFDRENILLVKSDEFFDDPQGVLNVVFKFLNIDPDFIPSDMGVKNPGKYKEISRENIDEVKSWLEDVYREHNEKLRDQYGIDFFN